MKRCLFGYFDHRNSVFPCTLENPFSMNHAQFDITHIQKIILFPMLTRIQHMILLQKYIDSMYTNSDVLMHGAINLNRRKLELVMGEA